MNTEFYSLLEQHMGTYSLMEIKDMAKLAYQSEFGPEHILKNLDEAFEKIMQELANMNGGTSHGCEEYIGNGLFRFPLAKIQNPDEAKLLSRMMFQTAKNHIGSIQGLKERIKAIEELSPTDAKQWLDNWEKLAYPPVGHSEGYRSAYAPHYRLVSKDFVCLFPVMCRLLAKLNKKENLIVSLEGRCGSGKTYYAGLISALTGCNVVHMDDFYLPPHKRDKNWKSIPGGNMDFSRLEQEILLPLHKGKDAYYSAYNCQTGRYENQGLLSGCRMTLLEGSYSQHPLISGYYDLKIFLSCPTQLRMNRLKAREGDYFEKFEDIWIPAEELYHSTYSIEGSCDCIIRTGTQAPETIWKNQEKEPTHD